MSDRVGETYALTVLSPIRPEKVFELQRTLGAMPRDGGSPFSAVRGTHCARWVVIPQLVYEAFHQRPDALRRPYLLFTANFDGALDSFLYRLHSCAFEAVHAVWGTCDGYPGGDDARRFVEYLKGQRVKNTLVVAAYPHSTVEEVRRCLAVQREFRDLALAVEGRSPQELVDRFRAAFPPGGAKGAPVRLPSNGSAPPTAQRVDAPWGWTAVRAAAARARTVFRDRHPGDQPGGVPVDGPDPRNLQKLVRGYGRQWAGAVFLFAQVVDGEGARRWLTQVVDGMTAPHHRPSPSVPPLSLAFTFAGLRAVGVPDASLESFPIPFREGMAARASMLGDGGSSTPQKWDKPFRHTPADAARESPLHLLVAVYAQGAEQAQNRSAEIADEMSASGVKVVGRQDACRHADRKEHFGFVDGISQPHVLGLSRGEPAVSDRPPIATGEVLLGHADEEGLVASAPSPSFLARDGTFLVYRKLSQDVAGFERLLHAQADRLRCGKDWLAAKLVGRWPDGTPVELHPSDTPESPPTGSSAGVPFRYGDDLDGARCPLGAHIRRANPRDGLAAGEEMVRRHRLIRRGIPYGPRLTEASSGADRGLVFLALVADIERQFEFVQRQWLNDGNVFGLGADADVIIGDTQKTGRFLVQGGPPRSVALGPQLTTTRAGEYFFLPGIDALRCVAAGWQGAPAGGNGRRRSGGDGGV